MLEHTVLKEMENENKQRLTLLLTTIAKKLLIKLLLNESLSLKEFPNNRQLLKHLERKTILYKSNTNEKEKQSSEYLQWRIYLKENEEKLDFNKLDFNLVVILIEQLCNSLQHPQNGWDQWPNEQDRSMPSNIVRLKLTRQELTKQKTITNEEFDDKWIYLRGILVEMGASANSIDNLKTCNLKTNSLTTYYNNPLKMVDNWDKHAVIAAIVLLLLIIFIDIMFDPRKLWFPQVS